MTPRPTPAAWRWRRWGLALGGVLLGSYLLYVTLATAFLSFGGLAWVTKGDDYVRIEVASGYSLIPGRVHVRGFKLLVRDRYFDMELTADAAELSLSLFELWLKRVHVSRARTHGTEYKLIYPVGDPQATAERLAAFPELGGFERPLELVERPATSSKRGRWTARFDAIEGDVRLVWLMEYRVHGKMWARGGFYLDAPREARVFPSEVVFETAEVAFGSQRIAHDLRGTLRAEIEAFTPRKMPTRDIFPKVNAAIVDFGAELDTLSFIELYARSERIHWEGSGRLALQIHMDHGQLHDGSTGALEMARFALRSGKSSALGTANVKLNVAPQGRLHTEATFRFPEAKEAAFTAELIRAEISLDHRYITDLELRRAAMLVEDLHFDSPDFMTNVLGSSRGVPASGSFDAKITFDAPSVGAAKVDAEVATRSTSFYLSGLRFGISADANLRCAGTRSDAACTFGVHAPYLLFDQRPGDSAATLWLRADALGPLRASAEQGTFSGTIGLVGGDPKAAVSEVIGRRWIAQLGLSLVPSGNLGGNLHLEGRPGSLSLSAIDVARGKSRVQGHLTVADTVTGAFVVELPTSRWGFTLKPGGISTHPLVGRQWLDAH